MSRTLISLLFLLLLTLPLKAGSELPRGLFKVVNTEGFVQKDGVRQALDVDMNEGTAQIELDSDNSLKVEINGARLRLFPLDEGLAALAWDADGTGLLHDIDIVALFGKKQPSEVPAWGADLDWPGSGKVQLVLLPLGEKAYAGFLISHPGDKTVVRQMEFRQAYGYSDRPDQPLSGDGPAQKRP